MINRDLPFGQPFRRRPVVSASSVGGTTTVSVASWLRSPLYYHWWVNGVYIGRTANGRQVLRPDAGEQFFLQVFDTRDPDYDPAEELLLAGPARRTLQWIRSLDPTCTAYQVQQSEDSGAWTTIAQVVADDTWQYSFTTEPLDDLAQYAWQVVPLNAAGRAGTAVDISSEIIVRTPDAPAWSLSFAAGQVTISI